MRFAHDVFLSYASADRDVVRDLAERLRAAGLRVWFDEWELRPEPPARKQIDDALEGSAVLVLCMSERAFGSDWALLEHSTFRHRDPLNAERRFIPLRLDDATPPGSLAQFLAADWLERNAEELGKLVDACARERRAATAPELRPAGPELGRADGGGAAAPPLARTISLGHTGAITAVAYHPDGHHLATASHDETVRVWDTTTATCIHVLEGHTDPVWGVAYHPDGRHLASVAANGVLRLWDVQDVAGDDLAARDEQVSYTNAKVVLVGESQAGKSGLALRLAHDEWHRTDSTRGAWATQLRLPVADDADDVDREIWLWDFGGQHVQRLVHQLYLRDAAVSVLVFDGQREDAVPRLRDWDRDLTDAAPDAVKLLVAGRIDDYPVLASRADIDALCEDCDFATYHETSARHATGCPGLRDAIAAAIDWSRIPHHVSPRIFKALKDEILALRDGGRALTSKKELRDWLRSRVGAFEPAQLDAVIGLLAGPGVVAPLDFGDYVLLRPELLNVYAQVVVRSLDRELGCIDELRVLLGDLDFPPTFPRLGEDEERIVLLAMHKQLVERSICVRQRDPAGTQPTLLVFPSYTPPRAAGEADPAAVLHDLPLQWNARQGLRRAGRRTAPRRAAVPRRAVAPRRRLHDARRQPRDRPADDQACRRPG